MDENNFSNQIPNSEALKEMIDRCDDGKRLHTQSEKINWKKICVIL